MGYYRPRPVTTKRCLHCGTAFESHHKRAQYCGESCRQLAYQARRRAKPSAPNQAAPPLAFSAQNVAVTALGAAASAVGNYWLNDKPSLEAILAKIADLEQGLQQGLNQHTNALQFLVDYVQVQLADDPVLGTRMSQLRAQRKSSVSMPQELGQRLLARRKRRTKKGPAS